MKTVLNRVWLPGLILVAMTSSTIAYDGIHGASHSVIKENYDSLYAEATPLDQSEEGQKVVDRCLAAYGGRQHLAELKTFGLQYRMTSPMFPDTSDFYKLVAPGRKFKNSRKGSGHDKIRYLNGNQAWRVQGPSLQMFDGPRYCAILFGYLTLSMPLALETEPFSEIRFGQRETDSLDYFYCKKNDSLMIVIGINAESSMIRSSEGVINDGDGYQVFVNLFDDYRTTDGYLWPHQLTNISQGLKIGDSELISVEVNPDLTDEPFRPEQSIKDSH